MSPRDPRAVWASELTGRWASAIIGTSYVPRPAGDVEVLLATLVARLLDAVTDDPSPAPGARGSVAREVGAALVEAHFTDVESLSRTLEVLHSADLAPLGAGPAAEQRWSLQLCALAAGYAGALRERALGEQEAILQAAFASREKAEQALRASEARFRAVFTGAAIGIGIGDMDGRILDVNPALVKMFGHSLDNFRHLNVLDFVHPSDSTDVWAQYQQLVSGEREYFRLEKQFPRSDGSSIWTHLTVSLLRDDDNKPRYQLALIQDVTDLRLLQNQLQHDAHHDPLTGLPNRTLFVAQLNEVFDGARDPGARVAVCFLDLDGFKVVNDSLGHEIGDQLLVNVARRLHAVATRRGHLIARLGGDEFVVLLRNPGGPAAATTLADELLTSLAEPVVVNDRQLSVSASIGIVERPVASTDPAELLRAADMTLYWAKADGKGRWALFEPERSARELNRYSLSSALPGALEHEHFIVHYQPMVTLASSTLHGVEALLRWQHPTLGLLGPDEFVGLAEESGVIVPLGRWVLQAACQQAQRWFGAAPDAPVISVNLAVQQLRDPMLVQYVRDALRASDLHPRRLQLEITESEIVGSDRTTWSVLRALTAMGVRIAIDDFGTGYSNLAYLRHLPVDELKLAASFVRGLGSGDASNVDEQIVTSLVALAHTLGLTVTGEGVESEEQVRRLAATGCDAAQGTYFGSAGSAEKMTSRLPELMAKKPGRRKR